MAEMIDADDYKDNDEIDLDDGIEEDTDDDGVLFEEDKDGVIELDDADVDDRSFDCD
ncbi:hypothetical protein IKF76_01000 [Candidatus Saccharibacteria bacterium]|nr:hypothetical protein [Candidatus Saccharibacteria bacterium]